MSTNKDAMQSNLERNAQYHKEEASEKKAVGYLFLAVGVGYAFVSTLASNIELNGFVVVAVFFVYLIMMWGAAVEETKELASRLAQYEEVGIDDKK